jgi:hypothetical protein
MTGLGGVPDALRMVEVSQPCGAHLPSREGRVKRRNPLQFNPLRYRHYGGSGMGKGCILWLIGVPIPVIIVLWLLFGH